MDDTAKKKTQKDRDKNFSDVGIKGLAETIDGVHSCILQGYMTYGWKIMKSWQEERPRRLTQRLPCSLH
jgi:hypothetical protein